MALNPPVAEWRGLRCWILGASTGIGEALALQLAERGARVAISARRRGKLEDLAARIGAQPACGGRRVLALPLDIRDAPSVALAADAVVREWGGLDLAIVMAGGYQPMRAWELDLDGARAMVETNVMGCFHALAAVIPQMMGQGRGTIALVSSVAGYRGLPKSLVYGPTKAAIINLAEALYLDLRPKAIGVCVVNPGFVKTPLTAGNEFHMPALISAAEAAVEIVAGLERGDFEIHFPRRFSRVMKLLRHLPYRLYFPAVRRMTRL